MLYSLFGVVSTTVRGFANSKSTRSNADNLGGSRCSTTSTTEAASKPSSRLSRYIKEPWITLTRSACLVGNRSSFSRRWAASSDRIETSMPTISSNCFSLRSSRINLPSPQPRSRTRFAPLARRAAITVPSRWSWGALSGRNETTKPRYPPDLLSFETPPNHLPSPTAEIGDALGPAGPQGRHNRPEPLVVQAKRRLQRVLGLVGWPFVFFDSD